MAFATAFMATLLLPVTPFDAQARTADSIHYSTSGDQATVGASIAAEGGIPIAAGATSTDIRDALGLLPADVVSISTGTSDPTGFEVFSTAATLFPTQGSDYFVMSSGATGLALTENSAPDTSTILNGLNNSQGEDMVQTVLVLQPPAAASCLAFDFAFYSEEFPEFVGSEFNDAFIAEIGQSTFQIIGNQVIAPNNFAFDTEDNVISVNTVFGVTAANADGTTYDGGTPLLTAKTPLENPGQPITVTLSIMDLGDSIYDSTVFVDNFRWLFGVACEPGADTDADRDALLDGWETNGIDFDNDGTVDLDLPAMGADPNHKDIFVEIDYMVDSSLSGHTHKPKAAALQTVIDAFENAPVSNPDGTTGIRIHIDAGSDTIMDPVTNATWGTRSESDALTHQNNLGTCPLDSDGNRPYNWTAFDGIKGVGTPGNFSIQRADVFHYNIWGHSLCPEYGTVSGISRGIPASDFLVTLGGWSGDVGTVGQQAGTLMHELGHGLSFRHGGDDHCNYEPNYLSVMNYSFQTRGLRIAAADGNFDYSRFALPTLNEANLDETDGIMGVAEAANYGTRFYDPSVVERIVNDINSPIDWNWDGDVVDTSVSVNINKSSGFCGVLTVLGNTDNWAEIVFNGGAVGQLGERVELPIVIEDPENTLVDITEPEDAGIFTEIGVSVTGPYTVYLAPGKSLVYSYQVTNKGAVKDTFEIDAVSAKGWADLTVVPVSEEIEPGESAKVDIQVTVPAGTPAGMSDVLTVTAHSTANTAIMDAIETTTIASGAAIDIKPGSDKNPINKNANLVTVAILGSADFDVANVDVTTLAFGPGEAAPEHLKNGALPGHSEDVNGDGYNDLVTHYSVAASGVGSSDVLQACLLGETLDGSLFGDCDSVSHPGKN
jgi:hypothetical protein